MSQPLSQPTYLDESIARMVDADNRRRDPATQWQADGYTPEQIGQLQRIQETVQALERGFVCLNQTYASM